MPAPPVRRASLPGARWCWGCASPPRVPRGRGGLVAGAMPQEDPTGPSAGCRNNELLGEAADETAPRVARGLAAPSAPVQRTGEKGGTGGGRTRVRPRHDPVSPAAAHPDGAVAAASFSPLAPRLPPSACYFGMGPPQHCPGGAGAPRGALQHQREGAGGSQRTLLGCRGGMWQSQGHPCPLPWLSTGRGARRGWGGPCRISPSGVR